MRVFGTCVAIEDRDITQQPNHLEMTRQSDNPFRGKRELPEIRTMFEDLDRAAVDALAEKFAGKVPESRIAAMRELPTSFDSPEQFRQAYKAAAGREPGEDVLGFSKGLEIPAHVRTDDLSVVPEAVIHERTHQLADPSSDRLLGKDLDEGVTERYALETANLNPEFWPQRGYEQESRSATEIEDALGRDAIESAYLNGDASLLAERLENRLNELPEIPEAER